MNDHDLLVEISTKITTILTNQTDHEARIRSLERWMWAVAGVAGVGGGAVADVVKGVVGG